LAVGAVATAWPPRPPEPPLPTGIAMARSIAARGVVAMGIGLCLGVALAPGWGLPLASPIAAELLCALAAGAALWRIGRGASPRTMAPVVPVTLALLALALLAGQVGLWRSASVLAQADRASLAARQLAGPRQLRGLVVDDPAPRAKTTSLTLSQVLVRDGDVWQPMEGRILVSVPHYPAHEYGEYLQLQGRLTPLDADSSSRAALAREGVVASMSYPRVSYLANPQANPVLLAIYRLRHRLAQTISGALPDPAASTLAATVLGLRSVLSGEEQRALVETGTVHLIVISGFKLSLIAAALQAFGLLLLRWLGGGRWLRSVVLLGVALAIAGYTILTGATPSAVRAAIMAGIVVLAALAGRPHDQLAALAAAVLVIIAASPPELWDGGFQLSVLSVLGITLLAEPLGARFDRAAFRLIDALDPESRLRQLAHLGLTAMAAAMAASLAATLFDLPVLAASFNIVSLVSPLANLLGMPVLWPVMVFGGTGALLGSVAPLLGAILLWPAWAFTNLLEAIVHASAALPYAAVPVAGFPTPAMGVYYAALLILTWWLTGHGALLAVPLRAARPSRLVRAAALTISAVVCFVVSFVAGRPPSALTVTFLALPGEAAVIQAPNGRTVLVNGGSSGAGLLRELGGILPPWQRAIDLVIVTSPRQDHVAGLEELFARYKVAGIIEPDVAQPTAVFRRVSGAVPRLAVQAGDQLDLGGGARLTLLSPTTVFSAPAAEADRSTMVWRLEQGPLSLLLAGRLPPADWPALGD